MSKKSKFALGTLLAAGAGYVIGLLTAPKSGRETRTDILRASRQAKVEAERKLKEAHSEFSKLIDEATVVAQNSKGKVSDEFAKARIQADQVKQKTKELLSAIHEGEAEDSDLQGAITDIKKATNHLKKFVTRQS